MQPHSKKTSYGIENLDLWALHYSRSHPVRTWLFLLLLMGISIAPFVTEFYMDERLVTQADVYDTNRVLFWLHLFTDIAIGLSYTFITAVLVYLTVKAGRAIPFLWAFVAFGVFIIACGMTHFMEAFVLWQPVYWIAGGIKWLTAVVSVGTAVTIPFLVPRALSLIEIAKVAHQRKIELEEANKSLTDQKEELEHQKKHLEDVTEDLTEKTQELEKLNKYLVHREEKMADMKEQIRKLEQKIPKDS